MNRLTRTSIAALAAALIVPLSGCAALISPQQTLHRYAAGDGASVSVGDVDVRSLKVVGTEASEPAQVLYVAINNGDSPQTLSLTIAGEEFVQPLEAGEVYRQNPDDGAEEAIIEQLGQDSGTLIDVTVSVGSETVETHTQVIGPAHEAYADYVPGGAPIPTPAQRVYPEGEEPGGH
ncbi:hypothetical protein [Sediminivirga luteola]|uniref:DNA modification methylase n=1 Tax=Sediminivirga luteola TaxID=1774748 RepID=A0A8J2XKF3_9MICO|nr:hypothetical protein [Sediminivirga luteola]MCI2265862.1 hypothetical protein [Sediminivirga luteola]GGA14001.1 hypothetical protein GCM10011333_16180 [Sediminivirga luteola]